MELVVENIQEEGEEGGDPGGHQDGDHGSPAQRLLHTVEILDSHLVLPEVLVGHGQ